MYKLQAGRIRYLDFEICMDAIPDLKKIKGIGKGLIEKLTEFLSEGKIHRLEEVRNNPKRRAIRELKSIWGVGPSGAKKLLEAGFENIEQVRKGIADRSLNWLTRNQLVGVECYEDFQERFSRTEAQKIFEIIKARVVNMYPQAEVKIMGSFRRGKNSCGDVDIHITSPKYYDQVPTKVNYLGGLVDVLFQMKHLAFHLTYVKGSETGRKLEDFEMNTQKLPRHVWQVFTPVEDKSSGDHSSSSYMGVFNSPTVPGKRRRVDIKFYPYRERIFASLYFTGNGHFNRSMRLWAKCKFGWTLNDHGLFVNDARAHRVMEEDVKDEKEIFDKLKLVWKEPKERDCFDAVTPKAGFAQLYESQDETVVKSELRNEDGSWVH